METAILIILLVSLVISLANLWFSKKTNNDVNVTYKRKSRVNMNQLLNKQEQWKAEKRLQRN